MFSFQVGNVVTIQAASVQEQLQRIQQLREQQQQKKRQAAEAKRELTLNAANQSDIIQKQVCAVLIPMDSELSCILLIFWPFYSISHSWTLAMFSSFEYAALADAFLCFRW